MLGEPCQLERGLVARCAEQPRTAATPGSRGVAGTGQLTRPGGDEAEQPDADGCERKDSEERTRSLPGQQQLSAEGRG